MDFTTGLWFRRLLCLLTVAHVLTAQSCTRSNNSSALFDKAQTFVVGGDVASLRSTVEQHPELKDSRSPWDRSTLLHVACTNVQSLRMVEALLELKFDPNALDDLKRTPLHLAYKFDADSKIIAALIDAGADPNLLDVYGKKPADYSRNRVFPAPRIPC